MPIWQQVKKWCEEIKNQTLDFADSRIMFNTISKEPKNIINMIVLITKHYIYRTKCMEQVLNVFQLKECILWHYKMELLGAKINGKQGKCEAKWLKAITVIKY